MSDSVRFLTNLTDEIVCATKEMLRRGWTDLEIKQVLAQHGVPYQDTQSFVDVAKLEEGPIPAPIRLTEKVKTLTEKERESAFYFGEDP